MFTELISASAITRANDEDLCSQINYMWTALIMSAMGLLVTMVQYAGDPIHCLCPAQLTEAQCNYTKALCWINHNYFVHEDSPIALQEKDRYDITVAYYPWIPWILFTMATLMNFPNIMWAAFAPSSGLDLKKFIAKADAHETLDNLGKTLLLWLGRRRPRENVGAVGKAQRIAGSCGLFWYGRHQRTYLCGLLLLTKLGYLLVSLGEFLTINALFIVDEGSTVTYGWSVIKDYIQGSSYHMDRFPIYTMCDIKIRQLANVQTYSFQCILPLNMYNQKMFLFLWFWLILISIINAYSFVGWSFHLLSFANRRHFVKKYVHIVHHLLRKKDNPDTTSDNTTGAAAVDGDGDRDAERDIDPDPPALTFLPGTSGATNASLPRRVRVSLPEGGRRVPFLRSRSRGEPRAGARPICSIEDNSELVESERDKRRSVSRITTKMMKEFGHDGVVVFRILENAVGVVISNRIFQELYEQLDGSVHIS